MDNVSYVARTERMLIRPFTRQDSSALAGILGDPQVMRYSIHGVCSGQETRGFIDWCLNTYHEYGYGPWALESRSNGRLLGLCGLSPTTLGTKMEVELSYRLARDLWGKGLATEAVVSKVLEEGFEQIGLRSKVVIIASEHTASLRVAYKAGFRNYVDACYHGFDVKIYRLTQSEWRSFAGEMPDNVRRIMA